MAATGAEYKPYLRAVRARRRAGYGLLSINFSTFGITLGYPPHLLRSILLCSGDGVNGNGTEFGNANDANWPVAAFLPPLIDSRVCSTLRVISYTNHVEHYGYCHR